jgi:ornithine cyclodeaminase/alanine dehydrogenase
MGELTISYFGPEDIMAVDMSFEEICQLVETTFREHAEGQIELPPKTAMHPRPGTYVHAMPAHLTRLKSMGIKYGAAYFENYKRGLPSINGLIILIDIETGIPLAIMDILWITNVRTAAVSSTAIKYLACKKASVMCIVGAGMQARQHVEMLNHTAPGLEKIQVYDLDGPTTDKFKSDVEAGTRFKVEIKDSIKAAIKGAHVNITATSKLDHIVFLSEWVDNGSLVLPVHTGGWDPKILHKADLLVFDDYEQMYSFYGKPGGKYYPFPEKHTNLGRIVAGLEQGRTSDDQLVVDFNLGMALHDMAIAPVVYERLMKKGVGTLLPYNPSRTPLPLSRTLNAKGYKS